MLSTFLPCPASKCLYAATLSTEIVANEPKREAVLLKKLTANKPAAAASIVPANLTDFQAYRRHL